MSITRRNTWQKEAVREALATGHKFVSAQQLFETLRTANSGIGLATVYRALAELSESGQADTVVSTTGVSTYRICDSAAHHHHLICRECGAAVEVETPPIEDWVRSTVAANGYTQPRHTLDVFGLCPLCQETHRAAAPEGTVAHNETPVPLAS